MVVIRRGLCTIASMRDRPKSDLGRQKGGGENVKKLRDEEGRLLIAGSHLLSRVFKLKGGKETQQEIECRFLLSRVPTQEDLAGYEIFDIRQVYVFASDEKGKRRRFRFRTTSQAGKDDELSVVYKHKDKNAVDKFKDKKGPLVSQERSIAFSRSDEREADTVREFDTLSASPEPGLHPIVKTRHEKEEYELPLPGGKHCKIHIDKHGGHLAGFWRGEIEFENPEDAIEVRERHARGEKILPGCIGKDVTDDPRYGSTSLAVNGVPREEESSAR